MPISFIVNDIHFKRTFAHKEIPPTKTADAVTCWKPDDLSCGSGYCWTFPYCYVSYPRRSQPLTPLPVAMREPVLSGHPFQVVGGSIRVPSVGGCRYRQTCEPRGLPIRPHTQSAIAETKLLTPNVIKSSASSDGTQSKIAFRHTET